MSASGQCLRQSRRNSSSAWFLKVRMRILIFCVRGVLASNALKSGNWSWQTWILSLNPKVTSKIRPPLQKPNFHQSESFLGDGPLYLEQGTSAMKLSIQYGSTKLECITPGSLSHFSSDLPKRSTSTEASESSSSSSLHYGLWLMIQVQFQSVGLYIWTEEEKW